MNDTTLRTRRSLHGSLLRAGAAVALGTALAGTAHAFPGELDLGYGTNGIAARTVNSSDFALAATGSNSSHVTGVANRGTTGHLFVANFRADGTLEPTFGTAGRTMLRLDHPSEGRAIRLQPDGKIVVAGTLNNPITPETLVVRFNANGTLDAAFGTGGIYTRKIGSYSLGYSISLQADGKILVGGASSSTTFDGYVLRLNADGTPDATFGTSGVKTLDWRGGFDSVNAVAELAGKVYVAGLASNGPSGAMDFAYARLNADGSVDTTFGPAGQNGLAVADVAGAYDAANAMTFDGLGSIYVGGTSQRASDSQYCMSVLKLSTTTGLPVAAWGNNGRAIAASCSGASFGNSLGVSPAGVVIAGMINSKFAMVRFDGGGTLDASFGTGGMVVDAEGVGNGITSLNTPDASSYLAVGSGTETADPDRADILRVRYLANGSRDPAYGTGGRTLTNLYTPSWDLRAIAATAEGKLVIAGTLSDAFDSDFVVARLNANGTLDNFFGQGGIATAGFGKTDDRGNALLVRPDGSIVVAGRSVLSGTGSFALAGFTPTGGRDGFFGQSGRTTHTMGIGYAEIQALANAPGNKFVAAGYAIVGAGNNDFAVARYNANGTLDGTFGTGGVVVTPFGALSDVAQGVAVQPDGKVIAAGYARTGSLFDFALVRYNTDGLLDATFGTGGKVTLSTAASNDSAHAIALLGDGRILVAGEAFIGSNNFMVARLNANGSLDATFGVSGLASIDVAGGSDAAWAMAVQPDGKIVLAGNGFDGAASGFALVRLNANGTLDGTFGNFGFGTSFVDVTVSTDTAYAVAIQPDLRIALAGLSGASFAVARFFGDDTIPDAFSFPTQYDVTPYTFIYSAPATITGLAAPTPITIQNGAYSIGCTGTWVSTAGFISNGQTLCVRQFSPPQLATTTLTSVTVGGVTGTFASVTIGTLDPAGDFDSDGIPNGVETGEGRNAFFKDNDIFGTTVTTATGVRLFAMQQYRDFLGREGDAGGITYYTNLLIAGSAVRANVIESFFNSPEFSGAVSPIARLYFAFFNRVPDYAGLQFQVAAYRAGTPLSAIANAFALSPEFTATYGALSDSQYVALLYTNVLGRAASQPEIDYHVARLAGGVTRGEVMLGFSESPEFVTASFNDVYVTMMYIGMLRRAPDAGGFVYWLNYLDTGNPGLALILGFLNAPEYRARFMP